MTNKLWQCPLKVERGTYADMPESWLGASVNYYVGAETYEEALKKAVSVLQSTGMVFIDVLDSNVIQLNPNEWWDGYVMTNFAEYSTHFPSQKEVLDIVKDGLIFHGPFAGWEDE